MNAVTWRKKNNKYIRIYIVWEKGHFKKFQVWQDNFYYLGNGTFYPFWYNFFLWDLGHHLGNGTRHPLGFGPLILWESIWESVFNQLKISRSRSEINVNINRISIQAYCNYLLFYNCNTIIYWKVCVYHIFLSYIDSLLSLENFLESL